MSTKKSSSKKATAKKAPAAKKLGKKAGKKVAKTAAAEATSAGSKVTKISFTELQRRVLQGEITEAELAPYFDEVPPSSGSLEPKLVMNENVTDKPLEESRYESALLLNSANAWAYQARKHRYKRKLETLNGIAGGGIRILAEGDSWFQYPIKLHDVIDHLADKPEMAVRCFSAAGDILSNMVAKPQFLDALTTEKPHVLLISGGGNDLVDGKGLRLLLRSYLPGRPAKEYLNSAYDAFKKRITRNYSDLFKMTRAESESVIILCHGYDYAIPNGGPWLGRPMDEIGISDKALQLEIMKLIVADINKLISKVCRDSADSKIHYVDMRGAVPVDGWHDEFHPTSEYYGHVADRFYKKINALV